jgi:3-oxoadipate enol-lactonase
MKKETFSSDYGDIYYELSGQKGRPALIFVHGVGMDHHTFDVQVEALKSRYQVLAWDLPGHGRSTLHAQSERYTRMAADCLYALMIETEISTAIMVGQSLRSMIVQHFQLKYPGQVLAAIHVPGIALKSHVGPWFRIFVPFMMLLFELIPAGLFYKSFGKHRAVRKDVQDYLSEAISRAGKKLVLAITRDMIYDLIDDAPDPASVPLLLTYGDKDLFFIRNAVRKWHGQATGSICVEIPNANHIANQDNPEAFNAAVLAFLSGIDENTV